MASIQKRERPGKATRYFVRWRDTDPKTGMLFSDAKAGLENLIAAVKEL